MYAFTFVRDQELPAEQDWIVTQRPNGDAFVYVKKGAPMDAIDDALDAYRQLQRRIPEAV